MSDQYTGEDPALAPSSDPATTPPSIGPDDGAPKRPAWLWWAVGGVAVVALVLFMLMGRTADVAVPQVLGLTQAEAETTITASGLRVGSVSEIETLAAPPGTVVVQSPAPGVEAAEGSAVDLEVSKIPASEVPDVVGMTLSEANNEIVTVGLIPGKVSYEYDAAAAGKVIAQAPEPGTSTTVATLVDMTVSKGEEAAQVPNVIGLPASDAEGALEAAGFAVKQVKAESASIPAGDVTKQSPEAGVVAESGSTVTITVSTGAPEEATPPPAETEPPADTGDGGASNDPAPEPTPKPEPKPEPEPSGATVPDLVGMGVAQAIGALREVALKAEFTFGPSDEYLLTIAAQDPGAGTELDKGSVVRLTIGLPEFLWGDIELPPMPTTLPATPGMSAESSAASAAP